MSRGVVMVAPDALVRLRGLVQVWRQNPLTMPSTRWPRFTLLGGPVWTVKFASLITYLRGNRHWGQVAG